MPGLQVCVSIPSKCSTCQAIPEEKSGQGPCRTSSQCRQWRPDVRRLSKKYREKQKTKRTCTLAVHEQRLEIHCARVASQRQPTICHHLIHGRSKPKQDTREAG
jgi:hypothetical protein